MSMNGEIAVRQPLLNHSNFLPLDLDSALGADEVVVIEGALDMAKKTTEGIVVKMDQVYMLVSLLTVTVPSLSTR